MITFAK